MTSGVVVTNAATGLMQGVSQEIVATQPAATPELLDLNLKVIQPFAFVETTVKDEVMLPQRISSAVEGEVIGPAVFPFHTSK
jgi:hypothetical protein